jgi:hypothetical protein
MSEPTILAVDWSGARDVRAQRHAIWATVVRGGRVRASAAGRTRAEIATWLHSFGGPSIVGLDFSFGVPAWFAHEHGCASIDGVWQLASREGERWLAPTPPFWRDECTVPPEHRFRDAEARVRARGFAAKSVFQLVGNGQVGAGSVRGMPMLAALRDAGFAIWPFDPPADRTVFEMYPTLLRARAPDLDRGTFPSPHARDATVSARVLWRYRDALRALPAAADATTALEGDIWDPLP